MRSQISTICENRIKFSFSSFPKSSKTADDGTGFLSSLLPPQEQPFPSQWAPYRHSKFCPNSFIFSQTSRKVNKFCLTVEAADFMSLKYFCRSQDSCFVSDSHEYEQTFCLLQTKLNCLSNKLCKKCLYQNCDQHLANILCLLLNFSGRNCHLYGM